VNLPPRRQLEGKGTESEKGGMTKMKREGGGKRCKGKNKKRESGRKRGSERGGGKGMEKAGRKRYRPHTKSAPMQRRTRLCVRRDRRQHIILCLERIEISGCQPAWQATGERRQLDSASSGGVVVVIVVVVESISHRYRRQSRSTAERPLPRMNLSPCKSYDISELYCKDQLIS